MKLMQIDTHLARMSTDVSLSTQTTVSSHKRCVMHPANNSTNRSNNRLTMQLRGSTTRSCSSIQVIDSAIMQRSMLLSSVLFLRCCHVLSFIDELLVVYRCICYCWLASCRLWYCVCSFLVVVAIIAVVSMLSLAVNLLLLFLSLLLVVDCRCCWCCCSRCCLLLSLLLLCCCCCPLLLLLLCCCVVVLLSSWLRPMAGCRRCCQLFVVVVVASYGWLPTLLSSSLLTYDRGWC